MAVSRDEVKRFARLSRVAISDDEAGTLAGELESIFGYIDTIRSVDLPEAGGENAHLALINIMRDDGAPHAPDAFSEALLSQASRREDRFLKVKKVLDQ